MPVAAKLNQVIGFLAKEEAAYGVAETLSTSADACTPYLGDGDPEPPSPISYVYDGMIGRAPGTLAPTLRTTPNGRFREGVFRCLPKGNSTALSASVTPVNEVHRFLKAAGFTATWVTDQWEYDPTPAGTTFTTLSLRQYAQGAIYNHTGVLCDFNWTAEGLGVPVFEFPYRGLASNPTDGALASLTYGATSLLPPVASAVVSNLGDFADAATLRSIRYARNRSIDNPRVAQNLAGGHAGFIPGGAAPTMTFVIEQTARVVSPFHTSGGLDAEALLAAATSVAVDVTFGSADNNTWSHSFPQCQLVGVTPQADGPVATVELVFAAHASTPSANDYEQIVFT